MVGRGSGGRNVLNVKAHSPAESSERKTFRHLITDKKKDRKGQNEEEKDEEEEDQECTR